MYCKCPRGETLATFEKVTCPESFGQIQRVAFQRINNDDNEPNCFTESEDIRKLSSWAALTIAGSSSLIVFSPTIEAPATDGGDARTFGGGNDTPNGIARIIGTNPVNFTGVLRAVPQSVIKAMKEYTCEEIGVYLFDEYGRIGCIEKEITTNNGTVTAKIPIPINSFFVGDKMLGGFDAPDSNTIQWSFKPNWADDIVIVTPEFNPLTAF